MNVRHAAASLLLFAGLALAPTPATALNVAQEKAVEEFTKKYTPVTTVIPLHNIPADTARQLIQPRLHFYALRQDNRRPQDSNGPFPEAVALPLSQAQVPVDKDWSLLKAIEESVAADSRTNAVVVTGTEETLSNIKQMLREIDVETPSEANNTPPPRSRIEVFLVKGSQLTSDSLNEPTEGVLDISRGEEKTFRDARLRVVRIYSRQPAERDNSIEISVSTPATGLQSQTMSAYGTVAVGDYEIAAEELAPDPGKQGGGTARLRVHYAPRQPVQAEGRPVTERDLKHYGLSAEDLEAYNLSRDQLREIGHSSLDLINAKDLGKAQFIFSEQYRCELHFDDVKTPYLIVRAQLQSSKGITFEGGRRPVPGGDYAGGGGGGGGQGRAVTSIFDNTLYLEPGKPAVLGITNLQEVLILVVRAGGKAGDKAVKAEPAARAVPR